MASHELTDRITSVKITTYLLALYPLYIGRFCNSTSQLFIMSFISDFWRMKQYESVGKILSIRYDFTSLREKGGRRVRGHGFKFIEFVEKSFEISNKYGGAICIAKWTFNSVRLFRAFLLYTQNLIRHWYFHSHPSSPASCISFPIGNRISILRFLWLMDRMRMNLLFYCLVCVFVCVYDFLYLHNISSYNVFVRKSNEMCL